VEAVVDRGFAFRLLVPVVDTFDQRLTFVLHGEVDDARGAAMRGCNGAGTKVV
jgi:hypothetical protein